MKKLSFPFDLTKDTPHKVANELAEAGFIREVELDLVVKEIAQHRKMFSRRNAIFVLIGDTLTKEEKAGLRKSHLENVNIWEHAPVPGWTKGEAMENIRLNLLDKSSNAGGGSGGDAQGRVFERRRAMA